MSGELFAHVAFVGIIVQMASALLLALLFFALRRLASHRPYLRDWSVAFSGLAVAIAALFVRYLASEGFRLGPTDFVNAGAPSTRLLYVLYQAGKLTFFAGLLTGAARFAGRRLPLSRRVLAALLLAWAVISVLATGDLVSVVICQTPIAIASTAGAGLLLLRASPDRRSFGTRVTATVCLLLAPLWFVYAWGFSGPPPPDHPLGRFLIELTGHNSFIDVVMQSVLGIGMVIALFQDLEREAEAARAERARLQARLAESRHLESLGVVVSGVAHELNNPLTAILGYAEELLPAATGEPLDEQGDGDAAAAAARIIHEQALRCRSIVRDLLHLSRPRPPIREPVAIGALVDRVARGFALALRRGGVRLSLDLPPDLPPVTADPSGIEQVLTNLIDNAIDVSSPGATIEVVASRRGEQCELVVRDEGPGIASDLAERIFEPFFTTKGAARGTGLGLAVTHRIVSAHGGTIRVGPRADGRSGACFVVLLPSRPALHPVIEAIAERAPAPAAATAATASGASDAAADPQRPLRVLIVDDEAPVRALLRRRLEQHGWTIVEAHDGADALERVRSAGADEPFDAVITDLKMRRVSGQALQTQLEKESPALARRLVAITGDLHSPDAVRFAAASRCRLFEKPLDLPRLVEHVAALAGRPLTPRTVEA